MIQQGFDSLDTRPTGKLRHFPATSKNKRLLEMCGVTVTAVLCAGDRLRDLQDLPGAACNMALYPKYGLELAQWLYERYGMKSRAVSANSSSPSESVAAQTGPGLHKVTRRPGECPCSR